MIHRICRVVLPGAALVALLAGALPPPAAAQSATPSDDMTLRPGDAVDLQIKDEPQLSGEFPVNEDGTVLFPLLGLMEVADRPFGAVRADLRAGYARELVNPVLVVSPTVRVAVLGEVRAPGVIPVGPTMTLGDVLAGVGGLTPRADEEKVSLIREDEIIVASLAPEAPLLDTRLRSGDRIVVGEQSWVRQHMPVLVGAAASVAAAAVTSLIVRR